jgi:site-specific recombinase XerD
MDNRLYISYFLQKASAATQKRTIYLSISIAGKRERVNTGVTVKDAHWDAAKCRIRNQDEDAFTNNKLLAALHTKVTEIYTECIKKDLPVSSKLIAEKLRSPGEQSEYLVRLLDLHNAYVKRRVGIEVSKATYTKYGTLKLKVLGFLKKQYKANDIALDQLNKGFLMGFELYLKADEHIAHNTTIKYIQFLKRVINYGIGMEWLKHDPFKAFKCSLHQVVRECLTQEEIDRIQAKEFATARLEQVRDIFIFSCYTGLAYADVKKLKHEELVKGIDGKLWIQTFRAKTSTRVPIPLLPQALKIIERQKMKAPESKGCVFHVPSNQKTNAYLKEIADLCDITKKLTFHIARHSFATTVTLSNGVPIETVSKMLGHTNIKTTQIYSKVVDFKISGDMAALGDKLNGSKAKPSKKRKS